MIAATASFMIPIAVVFPALLRTANTPPSSATLSRARSSADKKEHRWHVLAGGEHGMSEDARIFKAQQEDFHGPLSAGKATRVLLCL